MNSAFEFDVTVTDVAHAIQLSLAPVFLLNGLGVLLAMLTSRLARIVDRARGLEARFGHAGEDELRDIHRLLEIARRRGRVMNRAITLGTVAALLVSFVVVLLFAAAFTAIPLGAAIALVFIVAMLALVGALWCFLIEVRIATEALRFGPPRKHFPGQGD
jgi:hypothetical protein